MTTNTLIDLQEADSLNQMDTLRHWVSVDAGYQRSMRLDRDASDAGVLAGYDVLPRSRPTSKSARKGSASESLSIPFASDSRRPSRTLTSSTD